LAKKQLTHRQSPVSKYVTVSMGIGTKIPDSRQPATNLIEFTDSFLYQAKKAGRNQVTTSIQNQEIIPVVM
ncbi:MAG: diguanylate cyclase domain-containing protein, partial [Waterburya sp.]